MDSAVEWSLLILALGFACMWVGVRLPLASDAVHPLAGSADGSGSALSFGAAVTTGSASRTRRRKIPPRGGEPDDGEPKSHPCR